MRDDTMNAWKMRWIDVAKFVAIMAVLVDHTYGVLYADQDIARASCFI